MARRSVAPLVSPQLGGGYSLPRSIRRHPVVATNVFLPLPFFVLSLVMLVLGLAVTSGTESS